jgi:phage portal protein BeeE
METHKRKFFANGATPNMVVKHAEGATQKKILEFARKLEATHGGVDNAYKTLHLYPGADATIVGKDMRQIDFKQVQGAGETRIAAAAGVPPIVAGFSEGLQAATYANYSQARRRFGDGTIHPLWQNAAGCLAQLLDAPLGDDVRLWYDASDVPFLREDEKDAAEIRSSNATTIRTLVDAGFTPESAVAAVDAGDMRLLKHTGLFSVQLQPPGTQMNGKGKQKPAQTEGATP